MPSDQFDKEDPASFVNPFNFSSLLYDPNIKKFAEHVEKYPSFNQMAGQDGLPKSHDQEYLSAMTQIMNNVDLWTLTDRLCHALMQDPSMSSLLEIYANPSLRRKRKQETAHFNQDPCLKLILDEIENGGPAVMMRYWNDEKVLKMFGLVMGIPLVASENSRLLETENEDESIVHHTAIIHDVKLRCSDLKELASNRVSPQLSWKYKCNQIESTDEEHSLVVLMLKLNLVDLLFRRKPPVPLPYYWDGYVRTHSGNSRVKSSASTHNLPDQETQQGAGKDGLLTILTRVMSETPSTRFVQEFVLVLFLYHCLCTMPSDQFDIEDPVKKAVKLFAREKEYWESLEAE